MAKKKKEAVSEEVETEVKEKPKKNKVMVIFGAIILLVLIAQTALIVSMYMGSKASPETEVATEEVEEKEEKEEEEIITEKFPLDSFMVNLKSKGSADHYLRATITLKYEVKEDEELAVTLEADKVEIQDKIIQLIRTKTLEEVRNVDSTEILRAEIVELVNELLDSESILEVYFSEFIAN